MAQPPSRAVPTLVIWEGDASRARGQRQSLRTSSLAGHRLVQKAEHSASLLACTSLCSHSLIPTLGQCSPTLWSEGPSPGQMGMFTPPHGLTVGKNGDACAHKLVAGTSQSPAENSIREASATHEGRSPCKEDRRTVGFTHLCPKPNHLRKIRLFPQKPTRVSQQKPCVLHLLRDTECVPCGDDIVGFFTVS